VKESNRIVSTHNPLIKAARKLHDASGRREAGSFLIEGARLVAEAYTAGLTIERVFFLSEIVSRSREYTVLQQADQNQTPLIEVSHQVLEIISQTVAPQGIVAWVKQPVYQDDLHLTKGMRLLVADRIQDPGNLGTMIRLARAFALDALVLVNGGADPWSDKVVRASAGAIFALKVLEWSQERLVTQLSKFEIPLIVTAPDSDLPVWKADLSATWALVIGNESQGVIKSLRQNASYSVNIPMPGGTESLNAAMVSAIVLYESIRQKNVDRFEEKRE